MHFNVLALHSVLAPQHALIGSRQLTALLNSAGRLIAGGVLLAAGSQLTMPLPATADENKRLLEVRFQNAFQKGAQKSYFQVRAHLPFCRPSTLSSFSILHMLCCSVRHSHQLSRCAVASQCVRVMRCRSRRRLS